MHGEAAVGQAFAMHAVAGAGLVQQVDRHLFQHPCADTRLDVMAGVTLQHDAVDPGDMQQLGQQQAGRASADDCDLGAHGFLHLGSPLCLRRTDQAIDIRGLGPDEVVPAGL